MQSLELYLIGSGWYVLLISPVYHHFRQQYICLHSWATVENLQKYIETSSNSNSLNYADCGTTQGLENITLLIKVRLIIVGY